MIAELFLPKKIFGYRLLPEKTLGIALEHDEVRAVLIHTAPRETRIEYVDQEPIASGEEPYNSRACGALQALLARAPEYDSIAGQISASLVTFKELSLPLVQKEKIRLVVQMQLEELLPFPIGEALVDFIVTEREKNQSTILAAAVRKKDLAEQIALFEEAGIEPGKITIDIFSLYSLLLQIPTYAQRQGGMALIDVGRLASRIAFLEGTMLRMVRTIPKGLHTILRNISQEASVPIDQVSQALQSGSLPSENTPLASAMKTHLGTFMSDISFTLNAFSQKLGFYGEVSSLIFAGQAEKMPILLPLAQRVLQTQSELFDITKLFKAQNVIPLKKTNIDWNEYTLAIGAAFPAPAHDEVNLRRAEFALVDRGLLAAQINTALWLMLGVFGCMALGGYLHVRRLSAHTQAIETHQVGKLRRLIQKAAAQTTNPSIVQMMRRAERETSLGRLLAQMRTITTQEEEAWGALKERSLDAREQLLALTNRIDRDRFAISIRTVTMRAVGGLTDIEVSGILSPKQMGEEYTEYAKFEQSLSAKEDDPLALQLIESNPGQIDEKEGGLLFTVTLRKKTQDFG